MRTVRADTGRGVCRAGASMVAMMVVLLATTAAVSGAELLSNPGFETWSGSATADSWTAYSINGTLACSRGSTWAGTPSVSAHGGSECQRVSADAFNEQGGVYQRFASTQGVQYTVTAWMLTRIGGSSEVTAKLGVDPTGATSPGGNTVWSDTVVYNSNWTQKTINVTAAGSYVTVFLEVWHPHNDTSTNGAFFDDVSANVNPCTPPAAPTGPAANPSSVCLGSGSTLTASVASGCAVDWYKGSCYGLYVGTGTTLGVTPASTTTYYPRARNISTGCESGCGAGVTVTVNTAPSVPTGPTANPATISLGQSSTLSASVAAGCTVDWYSGGCGETLVGSGTSLAVSPTVTTTYYPRARNTSSGCTNPSCGSAVTVTVTGTAAVLNSGFETWSGTSVADNWTQYNTTASVACYKGSSFSGTPSVSAHGGSECQRVKLAASGAQGGVYQRFSSTVGTTYTVSAYLLTRLTNALQAEAKLGVDPSGATTPGANTVWSGVVSGDSSWTAQTLSVTATGSYITIFLDGRHPEANTNQCNVFFDDVSLSAPTPPATRYVKYHSGGTHDGTSWASAFDKVQDAIDVASSGDEIWVASGTYVENLTLTGGVAMYGGFAGTESARSQRNWNTNVTTLDGHGAGPVIEVARAASAATRVDGFTITDGRAVSGGGILLNEGSSPVIANNIIKFNHADCYGGGIFAYDGASPVIATNKIINNGALYNGGGICTQTGSPTFTSNVIACNSAAVGGGIYCGDPDDIDSSIEYIINNTIYGNSAVAGGGLNIRGKSSARISNNIIACNSSGILRQSGTGTPVLKKNDLFANAGYAYSGLSAGATDIATDPSLVSTTYGQVHIQSTSACRNAGDNGEVIPGYADMDNQTRVQNSTVDIGADESDGTTWSFNPTIVRVKTDGSDSNNGSTWALAKRHIQAAIDAVSASGGGEVWVKAGTYTENVNMLDCVYVYGGFAGTETARTQRNWTTNATTIDGGAAGKVVEAVNMGYRLSAIDGFTIRNGAAWDGAGVFCMNAAPQITNNTITANAARGNGGGVYLANSMAIVSTSSIKQNSALGYGGGLACARGGPEIRRDNIENNWACLNGCGVYMSGSSQAYLVNNRIVGNHESSIIPGAYGTALSADCYCSSSVLFNTIANNAPGSRGAIYASDYATLSLNSNIVAFNSAGGVMAGLNHNLGLVKNDFYNNGSFDYTGVTSVYHPSDYAANPQFQDSGAGDYRICSGSICINNADATSAPSDDYLGLARSIPDIGCYEYGGGSNPAPTVTSITPSSGPNTGTTAITNLAGTGFLAGATVKLKRTGCSDITATGVSVVSSTKITCSLDLTGKKTGLWDVVVTNTDSQSGTLAKGFGVTLSASQPYVGTTIDTLLDAVMSQGSLNRQVCLWGKVEIIDSSTFWLDDGSGTRVKVFAPGYSGIATGKYASARGTADVSSTPLILISDPSRVKCYN
jgi:hypothetical protein